MRGLAEDFTGRRFGRLIGIRLTDKHQGSFRLWLWKCDCGKEIERPSAPIKQGRQISCGCHRDEQSRRRKKHGKSSTRTYRCWIEMRSRCGGKDEHCRKHYSDRGIAVCDRWKSFDAFLEDMGECPSGMTIERIKNHKGYEAENCRWATQAEQMRNTRRTVRVKVGDKEVCLKDACAMKGMNYDRIRSRIRLGKSPQDALDLG